VVRGILRRCYGIEATRIVHAEGGHTNETWFVDRRYALRRGWRGKPIERVRREESVLAALEGEAVPRVVRMTDGAPHAVVDGRVVHLFTRCDGAPGPRWLASGEGARAREAMRRLASIHGALASLEPQGDHPWGWIAERLARVRDGRVPPGGERVLARIDALLATRIAGRVQWLHGDYHLGNLLWDGEHLASVVDFDDVGCGAALGEVAMAAFALARQDAGDARFAFDHELFRFAVEGTELEPHPDLARLFCGYQVLVHLEASQRGLWTLDPGIGFWPCWNALR
jgi:Ser/Thr protein kinase RdoA (MazF antagonist)